MSSALEALSWCADIFLWIAAGIGVVLDILSSSMSVRRRRIGGGPSPVIGVSLGLYWLRSLLWPMRVLHGAHWSGWTLASFCLAALGLHLAWQFVVPRVVALRT